MHKDDLVNALFSAVDDKNVEAFLHFMEKNCCFRFGNLPSANGLEEIKNFVGAFFDSIHGLKHEITESWQVPDGIVCHGTVTYTRHDMSVLSVPFANIIKMNDGKIYDYLIVADTSQLYAL
ncbi:nuclear transport factor 2 family protein [Colwelliaceae bacterium 6471]